MNKIIELYQVLKDNQGFTLDHDLLPVESRGYAVSYDQETKININDLNLELFTAILEEYQQVSTGAYIGAWVYENCVYFDVSQVVEDKQTALNLAKHYKQLAIFDLNTKQSILL